MARRRNTKLVAWIKRYRIGFAVITLLLYVAAVPATLIVFPDNSLWLGLLILFTGVTSTLVTLGDMLVTAEEAQKEDPA